MVAHVFLTCDRGVGGTVVVHESLSSVMRCWWYSCSVRVSHLCNWSVGGTVVVHVSLTSIKGVLVVQ